MANFHDQEIHRSWFWCAPTLLAVMVVVGWHWPRGGRPPEPGRNADRIRAAAEFALRAHERGYAVLWNGKEGGTNGVWFVSHRPCELSQLVRIDFTPGHEAHFDGVVMLVPTFALEAPVWAAPGVQTNLGGFTVIGYAPLRRELARLYESDRR